MISCLPVQIVLGCDVLVKGVSRRVIIIKSPDSDLFDEAIFIVKEDAFRHGVTGEEIIKEAQDVAGRYILSHRKKSRLSNIPAPIFALAGAALVTIAWFLSSLII